MFGQSSSQRRIQGPLRDAYIERRKARIDKELHGKATGGDVNFSG